MESETIFTRHVRTYFIERDEYLTLISDFPSMHAFYDACQSYSSTSIQLSTETGKMTMAGKCMYVPGKIPELTETLLEIGELGKTGWANFFAQFAGPIWTLSEPTLQTAAETFQPISAQWSQEGILFRFLIKDPSFVHWSFFQQTEPYRVMNPPASQSNQYSSLTPPLFSTDIHQTLFIANQLGYYSNPRTTTLREIAKQRGLSHTMVGRHLREAHSSLARNFLYRQ